MEINVQLHLIFIACFLFTQVVEQDIQHLQAENNTTSDQHPYFARTSSVASIVTVVEGSRRDSQRDFSRDSQPQTRQNSQGQVHREPSIRRSWRTNREGRSSRLLPTESRGGSGENTAEVTMKTTSYTMTDEPQHGTACELDSVALSQQSNRKESDQASKWMLNDGEEIVIRDAKCSATLSCRSNIDNQICLEKKGRELESTERVLLKPSDSVVRTLSSCKTSKNLASLAGDDGGELEPDVTHTGYNEVNSKSVRETSKHLYPTLYELDDHRETFGPVTLEPEIIAGKVQKLFRGSSVCSSSQEQRQESLMPQVPLHHSVPQELSQLRINKQITSEPVRNITTLPRTKKSQTLNIGFQCGEIGVGDTAQLNFGKEYGEYRGSGGKNFDTGEDNCRSQRWEKISPNEVTVPAKDIHPEVEEGGKVLFLIGDIDRVEGLKEPTETEQRTDSLVKSEAGLSFFSKDSNITTAIGFEGIEDLTIDKGSEIRTPEIAPVRCLPSPVDTRKVVRIRNVGRDSARDLTKLDREKVIYPSLIDFKQDPRLSESCGIKDSAQVVIKKHRRHHSDPTNGAFTSKVLGQSSAELLKDVAEEQVTEKESISAKKLMKPLDSNLEILPDKPENSSRTLKGESLKYDEQKPHDILKESACAFEPHSQKGSTNEDSEEADAPCTSMQPVSIQMPRYVKDHRLC